MNERINSSGKAGAGWSLETSLIEIFHNQVVIAPDAVALFYRDQQLTYAQLNERATILAQHLASENIVANDIIAICLDKGFDVIISIIAILKVGAAYMPVDPSYPQERISFMLEDASPKAVVSASKYKQLFPGKLLIDPDPELYDDAGNVAAAQLQVQKNALYTYVLFTSGSTGRPKGVLMRQQALVNLIQWQVENSEMGALSRTVNFSPLTFDVSFQEIFSTFAVGGTLFLIDDDLRLDPAALLSFLETHQINRLFLPFVALQMLCESAFQSKTYPRSLKEVMTAGEQLKITPQVRAFFSEINGVKLFNQYGPTEAHVVTSLALEGDANEWPDLPGIGRPIKLVNIYILDKELNEVKPGVQGELYIGGIALAEGYVNRPDLTREKFIEHKGDTGIGRIYKTGDLARLLDDGNIEFLGRIDDQIKIRGFRVELGEIETALMQYAEIANCVVIAQGDNAAQKKLVAYMVARNEQKDTQAVKTFLQKSLPDYMIPSAFIWLNEIPKTASGKVNKKALITPKFERPDLNVLFQQPKGETEKNIATVWRELLQMEVVGVNDNFFELGGNSILAQKTILALKQHHKYDIPITKLYQYPTIRELGSLLDKSTVEKRVSSKLRKKDNGAGVAIVGMAGRFPGAATIEAFWEVLKEGKETISFFEKEEIDKAVPESILNSPLYVRARGILDDVDHFDAGLFGINPKLAELMDPQMRIFLEVSREVLETTGLLNDDDGYKIGVFAGSNTNTYFNNNVFFNKDKIETQGYYQTMSVSEKDYLATRVAYHLNLKGPAVNVNSACSTSLLAIAQAVESLRLGQCDAAIAGGVAVNVPVKSGHLYEEGAMFSDDGRCRPFDAQAKGTVFSDGAGVVLLKRLEDALADKDLVYAVIKGIGVNNDGGGKGSFTAPSTGGQAEAISMAIQDAGVEAADISYIEAHGTATPLGDPIEVEGLKLAFGEQQEQQYCAIGSVKSNIGHLTHAAGVAGVIKTSLSLFNRKLVPSVNYKTPNPSIDFTNSPFVVNTQLKDWRVKGKRMAGVSSFGIGGTNVHIILEEVEQLASQKDVESGAQIISWSSKTERSNILFGKKLLSFIQKNSSSSLTAIARHLQTTRPSLGVRTALVARDIAGLRAQLEDEELLRVETRTIAESDPNLVFVFPGQGSQFVNMGKELYDNEPVYKAAVDECAELLMHIINEDIRNVLFAEESEAASEKLKNTYYTQPATFIVSYALAKYYMSIGINPVAMVGHSIGEFVCAHLAGVMSLSDVIKIVAARASLISQLPAGTMLSVRAPGDKVRSLMPDSLSVAAINAPNLCVVSGDVVEVNRFSALLDEHQIINKSLRTSHAFHSGMMDPILAPLKDVIASCKLSAPKIPILSTVMASWLTDSQAQDAAYWSEHARATVNFSDAISELVSALNPVFLEVGPGNATTTLIKQHNTQLASRAIHSIETGKVNNDLISVNKAIAKLWTAGVNMNWSLVQKGTGIAHLHNLPTYAYDKKKYWIEPAHVQQVSDGSISAFSSENEEGADGGDLTADQPLKRIISILEEASGNKMEDFNPNLSFIELGFDSLLLTQIASTLKREFKVPITFKQLNEEYGTIKKLSDYLATSVSADILNFDRQRANASASIMKQPGLQAADSDTKHILEAILSQMHALTQQVARLQEVQAGILSTHGNVNNVNSESAADKAQVLSNETQNPLLGGIKIISNSDAPLAGARLGKDKNGNPAWFVKDDNNPGRYLQISI
ncbi:amino acid adenylation domain-containing protein [Niabella yanshanensis]|uniref:Amino acid adenylation domain-containing protein n=1 Tax=Niabella yanshanensis TaxID=577386 RepID=A0ABZ0W954_9BACT|nr:polyketide synthase [Niabella yanshanensis]WQD39661.1 amino acid adenylation domain-containing protein [Niabella yanshanensis]